VRSQTELYFACGNPLLGAPSKRQDTAALQNVAVIFAHDLRLRFGVRRCLRRFSMQQTILGGFVTVRSGQSGFAFGILKLSTSPRLRGGD